MDNLMKYSIKLIEIENDKGEITHIEQYAQTKEVNPSQKEEFKLLSPRHLINN